MLTFFEQIHQLRKNSMKKSLGKRNRHRGDPIKHVNLGSAIDVAWQNYIEFVHEYKESGDVALKMLWVWFFMLKMLHTFFPDARLNTKTIISTANMSLLPFK